MEYTRPHVTPTVFEDETGATIQYGDRWASNDGMPPDDSYSVVSNPERFAPLHTVAESIIEHLTATYDVDVETGPHVNDELDEPTPADEVVRAVRLTPRDEDCAALTIVLTDFPAVHIYAGVLYSNTYPSCGCDACDERWEDAADELEWETFAIIGGGLTEAVGKPRRPKWKYERGIGLVKGMGQTVSYRIRTAGGDNEKSGQSPAADIPATRLQEVTAKLTALSETSPEGNWKPWPKRQRPRRRP
ncbi:MAG: DUF6226 family protein [Microbacteriaceae bacterium]